MTHRRKLTPEFEHDLVRHPHLGYEKPDASEFVHCVEHGSPTPLERWHCHDEYELQLIVEARGQAFVGDYVGHFEPGHAVLTGPRLPHNWISEALPPGGLAVRSLVVQFRAEPLHEGLHAIKELAEIKPLLERARRGIEFFGVSDSIRDRFYRIKQSHGLERFVEFMGLLSLLQRCPDYRLLSSAPIDGLHDGNLSSTVNDIIDFITERHADPLSIAETAAHFNMTESRFSRYFNKATDSTFSRFVNRIRIQKACELLMHTESQISSICYDVGFNNIANFNRRFREEKGMTPKEFRASGMARLGGAPVTNHRIGALLS